MNKTKWLKILNPILGTSFLLQVISTVAIIFRTGPRWMFKVHSLNGMVFIIVALIHISINWSWIKANIFK